MLLLAYKFAELFLGYISGTLLVSEMTYNVSSWTLNPTIPYHLALFSFRFFSLIFLLLIFSFIMY